jgi:hypothetical protein
MKGRAITAVTAAGLAAGLALSACGGSSAPPEPKLVTTWNVDSGADAVIEVVEPGPVGTQANYISPYDGASIPTTTVEPANLGNYNPVCKVSFPGDTTWYVYDTSGGTDIGAGAQADCSSIDSAPGAHGIGPAFS